MAKSDAVQSTSARRRMRAASKLPDESRRGQAAATATAGPAGPQDAKFQDCATSPEATAAKRWKSETRAQSPATVVWAAKAFGGAKRSLKTRSNTNPGRPPSSIASAARPRIAVETAIHSAAAQTSPSFFVNAQREAASPARRSDPRLPPECTARAQAAARSAARGTSAHWVAPNWRSAGNPRTRSAAAHPAAGPSEAAADVPTTATNSAAKASAIDPEA